jgi:hypothetical protein
MRKILMVAIMAALCAAMAMSGVPVTAHPQLCAGRFHLYKPASEFPRRSGEAARA